MPENGPERIAAVVVTYNRKALLDQCVESLLKQTHPLDGLYIVDNGSTDGTYEHLLRRELISAVESADGAPVETARPVALPGRANHRLDAHYIRMPDNAGGAGGFHEGMKRAVEGGFDWLWLMDDDVLAAPDALETLVRKKEALDAVPSPPFILNSLVLSRTDPDEDRLAFPLHELSASGFPKAGGSHGRLSEVRAQIEDGLYPWICPFNGTFVSASAVARIGLPNRDLFIWGDDADFRWRAAKAFRLYTVVDSKVFHPPLQMANFDWKQYYLIRNMFVVNRHLNFPLLRNLRLILFGLGVGLRHGRRGRRLVLRAIRDGLTGRLGRRDDLHL